MFLGQEGGGGLDEKLYVEDVFSAFTYTGSSAARFIQNGIDFAGKGGLAWLRSRGGNNSRLTDTVRGTVKSLSTDTAFAEAAAGGVTAFNADGFSLSADPDVNASGQTYISWTFRKAKKFFDIVTYTGNGAASRAIAHNLGATPGMVTVKSTSNAYGWYVWHRGIAATEMLLLNDTSAKQTSAVWGNTAPTDTHFIVDGVSGGNGTNQNGVTYVAYLWAHDTSADGIIQCGTFTTDSGSNASVNLGWEPQFVLVKATSAAAGWIMLDTARGFSLNSTDAQLRADVSDAENTANQRGTPTSEGFNYYQAGGVATYVYVAIRKGLMRTPTDATKVFAINARTGTGATATVAAGAITQGVDLCITKARSVAGYPTCWYDRSRGDSLLTAQSPNAETATTALTAYLMNGVTMGANANINESSRTYINYFLKQARGFFDIVAYTGTGVARTVSHNLNAVPELIIVKSRSATWNWAVYYGVNTNNMFLNLTDVTAVDANFWNNTSPTASVFTVGNQSHVNANAGNYVAYLFASCPGVSKIGTFTTTGAAMNIDCGFVAGARFILLKPINGAVGWRYWDTTRGISTATDPFMELNSTNAESAGEEYLSPYAAGFTVNPALAGAGVNYLYLAIA